MAEQLEHISETTEQDVTTAAAVTTTTKKKLKENDENDNDNDSNNNNNNDNNNNSNDENDNDNKNDENSINDNNNNNNNSNTSNDETTDNDNNNNNNNSDNTNSHQKQKSDTGNSHSSNHSNSIANESINSLALDHVPVQMSDDEDENDNYQSSPSKKITMTIENDSTKDLQNFDNVLGDSMLLDKEINNTLERSRHNSPKKKNNDTATAPTFDEDASTVTGTGVTTADETTPGPMDYHAMKAAQAQLSHGNNMAVTQQRLQQLQNRQQINSIGQPIQQINTMQQQQPPQYGIGPGPMGPYRNNQFHQPHLAINPNMGNNPNNMMNPNMVNQQPQYNMNGQTPGNNSNSRMLIRQQGETKTNGHGSNDDSIISTIANNLRDPNVQFAIVGFGVVCVVGYIVYKKIKNRDNVSSFISNSNDVSWNSSFRRRRPLSAYHKI